MIYFHLFIYYTFFCSAILFYGIGLNRTVQVANQTKKIDFLFQIKAAVSILASSIVSYLLTIYLLLPLRLVELYPLVALFTFVIINILIESVIRITANKSASEFSVSFLIVLLAVNESTSIFDVMIICFSAMCAFSLLIPLINAFQNRIHIYDKDNKERRNVLVFLSIAVIIILLAVCDVSWLNLK